MIKLNRTFIAGLLSSVVAIALSGAVASAADQEKAAEVTVDHSKNPITGTKTTKVTKKYKKKGMGKENIDVEQTDTTKVHTSGKVEHTTETNAETTPTK